MLKKSVTHHESSKYHDTCAEISLYNLIKVLVSQDYTLIGKGSEKVLKKAWDNILNEFQVLANPDTQEQLLSIVKEISIHDNNLRVVQAIAKELNNGYQSSFCELLIQMGFQHKFTPENFVNDLRLTVGEAQKRIVDLERYESKENNYSSLLCRLSNHLGYRLDPKQISAAEFAAILNNYNTLNN